jgi:fused signal recognition particle receptor
MGFFDKIREGIKKTKDSMMEKVERVIHSFTKIDEDFLEELEETLIMSDVGVQTSADIVEQLRKKIKETGVTDTGEVKGLLQEIVTDMLREERPFKIETKPSIIFVIGVNGAGKTTTIGKMAANYKAQGKKVLVAAADTFRAAAIDQLQVWTDRAGVDIVKHKEGADPAAVVYDSIDAAMARGVDLLLIDTAGRLHNKKNLMAELHKMFKIVSQKAAGCDVEVLLVLDATTGQNAVSQAELFKEAADITGIVLTKLDGTAKGGIVISLKNQLNLPVRFVGVGEQIDDLQEFVPEDFARALFE